MKKFIFIILAAGAVMSSSVSAFAVKNTPAVKVIAYYFHGAFRCPTCMNMEKYSREALEANFKEALASGRLEFKAVNVEDKGNEHFVNDYQLYTKSLVLSLVKEGREIKRKNLDKIWTLARHKEKFMEYVRREVAMFMKDAE